jgi:hypothetical protein
MKPGPKLRCAKCKKIFRSIGELEIHIRMKHPEETV